MSSPFLRSHGSLSDASRIAVWIHWEAKGRVSDADLQLLRHLKHLGNSIVAVGNRDDGGSQEFETQLDGVADVVLQRPNRGYDFGGYREGMLWLRPFLEGNSRVILLNNSTYGPFGSLQPSIRAADASLGDVWGLTSSLEIQRHIQSYFLIFHRHALHSARFWNYWESLEPPNDRESVVVQCEVPLLDTLVKQGLRVRSILPYEELANIALHTLGLITPYAARYKHVIRSLQMNRPMNPTHQLWRWLPLCGVPLVKKELLRFNPARMPDAAGWKTLLPSGGAAATMIEEDLRNYAALPVEMRGRVTAK